MTNYHTQDGCWKCRHVFRYIGYEDGPYYFCTSDAPPRPPCGSSSMDESWPHSTTEFSAAMDKWEEWSKDREVSSWGTCDSFEDNPEMEHFTVSDPNGYLED